MRIRLYSITYAMKAKELLMDCGIDASVVKDLRLSGGGCVYAVSFPDQYKELVIEKLKDNKIKLHSTEKWYQ